MTELNAEMLRLTAKAIRNDPKNFEIDEWFYHFGESGLTEVDGARRAETIAAVRFGIDWPNYERAVAERGVVKEINRDACATAACIAGTACLEAGYEIKAVHVQDYETRYIVDGLLDGFETKGAEALGLTPLQASDLFLPEGHKADISPATYATVLEDLADGKPFHEALEPILKGAEDS